MKQILLSTIMLVVLGATACGNRNNTEGADQHERMQDNNYDTPIDTLSKDSIDSLPGTPIMPMM